MTVLGKACLSPKTAGHRRPTHGIHPAACISSTHLGFVPAFVSGTCRLRHGGSHFLPLSQTERLVHRAVCFAHKSTSPELEVQEPFGHVEDVMSDTDLLFVKPDTTIADTFDMLHRVSGLPVVNEDMIVIGVVSRRDVWKAKKAGVAGVEKVESVMSSPAVTVRRRAHIAEAAAKMLSSKVHRLPVVNRDGRLVGVVSRPDVFRPLVEPHQDLYHFASTHIDPFQTLADIPINYDDYAEYMAGLTDEDAEDDQVVNELWHAVDASMSVDAHVPSTADLSDAN